MANYEGKFESTGIVVKDPEKFERILRLLGFVRDGEAPGDRAFDTFKQDGELYFGILGYESVPNYIGRCRNEQNCDDCPIKEFVSFKDECPMRQDENGDINGNGDAQFDITMIIQAHMKPGTTVRIVEIGNEKLRYLAALETIITEDDIVTNSYGVEWGDIEE